MAHMYQRLTALYYTRRQINLYRMFFADLSVNSQPILMKFWRTVLKTYGNYREVFIKKYWADIVQKLDYLTCNYDVPL